jgi:hypothetical protein
MHGPGEAGTSMSAFRFEAKLAAEATMASITELTQAERTAEKLGRCLGAASHSERLSDRMLKSMTEKAKRVVAATALDEADNEAADDRLAAAIVAGSDAADRGAIDPEAAADALDDMDEEFPE